MSGLLEVVGHWPWATIAAFAAVGVSLYVGQTQINQRRRLLGRETVGQLCATVHEWTDAAVRLAHHRGRESFSAVLLQFRRESAELTKSLIVAQMACHDAELQRHLEGIVSPVNKFTNQALPDSAPPGRELSTEAVAALDALITEGTKASVEFLERAQLVYASQSRWRRRCAECLRD